MLIIKDTLMLFTCKEIQKRSRCQKYLKKRNCRRVSDILFSVVYIPGFLKHFSAVHSGSAAVLGDSSPAVLLQGKKRIGHLGLREIEFNTCFIELYLLNVLSLPSQCLISDVEFLVCLECLFGGSSIIQTPFIGLLREQQSCIC